MKHRKVFRETGCAITREIQGGLVQHLCNSLIVVAGAYIGMVIRDHHAVAYHARTVYLVIQR